MTSKVMEKIFQLNKFFVIFCGLLVAVWLVLQYVSNMRVAEEAKQYAVDVFTFSWPDKVDSKVEITQTSVMKKEDNQAVVKVQGKQTFKAFDGKEAGSGAGPAEKPIDCSAVLTLYRLNRKWVLGRVEFD